MRTTTDKRVLDGGLARVRVVPAHGRSKLKKEGKKKKKATVVETRPSALPGAARGGNTACHATDPSSGAVQAGTDPSS